MNDTLRTRDYLQTLDRQTIATDEQILYTIGNRELIKSRILSLYGDISSDIETDYEILQRISASAPEYGQSGGSMDKDIYHLIEMKEKIKKQQIKELHEEWNKVLDYEMWVHWIWQAYRALPKKQYFMLECLAVKRMKWDEISKMYGYSQSSISRIRRAALDEIRHRFQLNCEKSWEDAE